MTDYTALVEKRLDEKEVRVAAKLLVAVSELVEDEGAKETLIEQFRKLQGNFNHNIDEMLKIIEGDSDATTKA